MAISAEWLEFAINEARATLSKEIQYLIQYAENFLRDRDHEKFDHEFQKSYQTFVEVLPVINENFFDQMIQLISSIAKKVPKNLSALQQKVFFITEFIKEFSNLAEKYNLNFELTDLCANLDKVINPKLDAAEKDEVTTKSTLSKNTYQLLTEQARNHKEEIEKWLKELEKIRSNGSFSKRLTSSYAALSPSKNYKLDFVHDSQSQRGRSASSLSKKIEKAELKSSEILESTQVKESKVATAIKVSSNSTIPSIGATATPTGIFFNGNLKPKGPFIDPNLRNEKGQTPLHLALEKTPTLENISKLVEAGASIYASDDGGNSIMHYVLKYADIETVKWFLDKKIDIFAINHNNENLLHVYIQSNLDDLRILDQLIKLGIDIKARDGYKNSPLHVAVDFGKVDYFQSLINHGVDINARGPHDNTALHNAALKQNVKTLYYFLEAKNIDITAKNKSGETFLHLAVKLEIDILPTILQNFDLKNCINLLNAQGKSVLDIALEKKNSQKTEVNKLNDQIIKILKSKGAKRAADIKKNQDTNNENNNFYQSVDIFGGIQAGKYNISVVQNLPSINIRNDQNQTLLHHMVLLNRKDDVEFLLKNRINISATSKNGNTALHDAMLLDNNEIILMLLSAGAKLDIINQKNLSPLHIAANHRKYATIKLIINSTSDQAIKNAINLQDGNGNTVAHLLILRAQMSETKILLETIKLLIDNQLLLHTLNADGRNLLDCARERNIASLVDFLTPCYKTQPQIFTEETSNFSHSP